MAIATHELYTIKPSYDPLPHDISEILTPCSRLNNFNDSIDDDDDDDDDTPVTCEEKTGHKLSSCICKCTK